MAKKANGGTKAENIVKVIGKAEARENGKAQVVNAIKAVAKPKIDRVAERRQFIKQNSARILKAWADLKGKKSGAALLKVLPSDWHNKWIDEVLHVNGLRKSGEKVVTDAVAEDQSFLKSIVTNHKDGAKA